MSATIPRPVGPSDQLLCSQLLLRFADQHGQTASLSSEEEPDLARKQGRLLGDLEPYQLEARGNPLRLDSAVERIAIRGRSLKGWIGEQRVSISGTPASIAFGHNQMEAAWIDYAAPPKESPQAVGELSVAGPGWLRVVLREDQPDQLVEARWGDVGGDRVAMRIERDRNQQPVLTLAGKPQIAATGLGKLGCDKLVARMREVAPDGPAGPAVEVQSSSDGQAPNKLAVMLERIDAIGAVGFQGRELTGSTDNLVAWFRPIPQAQESRGNLLGGSRNDQQRGPDKTYRLKAAEVQLEIGLAGRRAIPTGLICHRGVKFEEMPRPDQVEPLRVSGEELRVEGLDRPHARLTVAGASQNDQPQAAANQQGMAQVEARGMRLWATQLHVDQAASRVWSDGPGNARVRLDQQAAERAGITGEATLRWAGGLEFDGNQIQVNQDVFGEVSTGWLHCEELIARLSQPIDLRNTNSGSIGRGIDLAEVHCRGGVTIDQRTSDQQGQLSHERARISTLTINQTTGDLSGEGPGWIRSVRLTDGQDGLAKLAGGNGPEAAAAPKLRFLRVNFQQGMTGNLNQKAVQFHDRVRAVYGPVLAWDQELQVDSPRGLPPDVVGLDCDELRVNEDPAGRFAGQRATGGLGPMEVRALGRVRLEGTQGDKGASFTAEGAAASYTQLKEVFILEGDSARNATLWVKQNAGSEPAKSVARKISYDRRTGRIKGEDIRSVEYEASGSAGMFPQR